MASRQLRGFNVKTLAPAGGMLVLMASLVLCLRLVELRTPGTYAASSPPVIVNSLAPNPRYFWAGAAYTPSNKIYMVDPYANSVFVVDGTTNKLNVAPIRLGPGSSCCGTDGEAAMNEATGRLYVGTPSGLAVIDVATDQLLETIDVGGVTSVAVDSNANRIYAASSSEVFAINGTTKAVTNLSLGGAIVTGVVVNPSNNRVYVFDAWYSYVLIFDGNTNAMLAKIGIPVQGSPADISIDPDLNQIYLASFSGPLAVLDGATNQVTTIPTPDCSIGRFMATNKATHRVYINCEQSLTIVDAVSQMV